MDRKEFLARATQLGVGCCAVSLFGDRAEAGAQATQAVPTPAGPPVTPDKRKVEWAKVWTKRFFDVLDQELDEPTRRRIMERTGTLCHEGSMKGAKPPTVGVERMVKAIAEHNGPDSVSRDGNVIHFNYVKNSAGLRVADGYCLCPLVEDGPADLSPTFCHCSVGYVRHMFETALGRKTKVDLLESVRRRGKTCRFRIELLEA